MKWPGTASMPPAPPSWYATWSTFVSRGAMDIVGMGIRIVEKLIETGKVKDVADIYRLKRADILEAVTKKERKTEKEPPGKIADNLLASIESIQVTPPVAFDHCSGNPRRG